MPYADPEKQEAYNVAYRKRRRQELNDIERRRYHEEGGYGRQREYRRERLDRYAEYQRSSRFRRPREALISQAKSRSKKQGIECTITVADVEWPTHCPILGLEIDYNKTAPGERKIRVNCATLDRKDNSKGYVPGNVFVLSHRANRIKSDATLAELMAIVRYLSS